MRDRFGARDERSWKLRFHTQTAGCSLTWQQPYNNVVRTALQALAGVLGGTQSLHTNSLDEAYALPSEEAVTIALRTQQIIAHESNVTATADPLGGSYFVEALTAQVEARGARLSSTASRRMGGMIPAIERGFPQAEIAEASYAYQREVESRRADHRRRQRVSRRSEPPHRTAADGRGTGAGAGGQAGRAAGVPESGRGSGGSGRLAPAAAPDENTMPYILEAVRAYATLGEICDALRDVFGTYQESSIV